MKSKASLCYHSRLRMPQNDFDSIRCGERLFGMPSRRSWQRGQLKQKHEMLRETPRKRSPDGKRMEKMELG